MKHPYNFGFGKKTDRLITVTLRKLNRVVIIAPLFIFLLMGNLFAQGKSYTREQFEHLLVGKNRSDISNILGKPTTSMVYQTAELWEYENRFSISDSISGKTYTVVSIMFSSSMFDGLTLRR